LWNFVNENNSAGKKTELKKRTIPIGVLNNYLNEIFLIPKSLTLHASFSFTKSNNYIQRGK